MKRFVLVHPEWGIYVGNGLGLGFFTLTDTAGQLVVVTFPSERDARLHVASWNDANRPDDYRYVPVPTIEPYAGYDVLAKAGLEKEAAPLRMNQPVEGHA